MTSREATCWPTVQWTFAPGAAVAHRAPTPKPTPAPASASASELKAIPAFGPAISRAVAVLTLTKQVRAQSPASQPGLAR
jgi:hypothetical protein